MSIKITVHSAQTLQRKGVGKASGKPYEFYTQTAYAHTVNENGEPSPYPEKIELVHNKPADAYAPGDYTIHPSSFYVNDKKLMQTPRLVPLKRPA